MLTLIGFCSTGRSYLSVRIGRTSCWLLISSIHDPSSFRIVVGSEPVIPLILLKLKALIVEMMFKHETLKFNEFQRTGDK